MINAVYHDKPLMFYRGYVSGEARFPSLDGEYKLLITFESIKAISDSVIDMKNAVHQKRPLMFIGAIRLSLSRLFLTLY